jgi:hypothetical protein
MVNRGVLFFLVTGKGIGEVVLIILVSSANSSPSTIPSVSVPVI